MAKIDLQTPVGTTAHAFRAAVLTSCSTSNWRIRYGMEQLSVDQADGCCPQKRSAVLPSTRAAGPAGRPSRQPVLLSPDSLNRSIWSDRPPTRSAGLGSAQPPKRSAGLAGRPSRQPCPSRTRLAAPIDIDEWQASDTHGR